MELVTGVISVLLFMVSGVISGFLTGIQLFNLPRYWGVLRNRKLRNQADWIEDKAELRRSARLILICLAVGCIAWGFSPVSTGWRVLLLTVPFLLVAVLIFGLRWIFDREDPDECD